MTGYGYKAREVDKTTVDWAGITKKISDDLISEENRREKLKLELEETHLEELKKIEDYPQGLDKEANVWAQERAQEAKRMLLERYKLMKSGLVSVNDSKLYRTRVNNTWDNLTSALNTYNENFKRISEAKGKGNEAIAMEMGEFANIDKRTIQYDSQGNGFYADIDPETGKIIEGSIKPVKAFNNIQAQEFAYVDVNQVTTDLSKDVPAWKNAITSTRDISNARLNPAYKDWLENTTTSQLNTDDKIASVLMDYLGLDYDRDGSKGTKTVSYEKITGYDSNGKPITETVTKEMGHVKMVYKDGKLVPELTEDQKEYAREAFKNAIEAKLISETNQQFVRPSEASIRRGQQRKTKEQTFNAIVAALQGDEEKFRTLFDSMEQASASIVDGKLKILGKDAIDISTSKTISGAGGRIAAQLGFSAEEFEDFVRKNNVGGNSVSEKFASYKNFDTTSFNTVKNREYIIKEDGMGQEPGAATVVQRLTALVGPGYNINYEGNDIIINGTRIPDGANQPALLLETVERSKDKADNAPEGEGTNLNATTLKSSKRK